MAKAATKNATKRPAARKPETKRPKRDVEALFAAVAAELAGTNPNQPVATLAALSTRMAGLAKPLAAKLKKLPDFQPWWIDALPDVIAALEEAEANWATIRASSRAGVSPKRVKEAEKLKSDLFGSARYLLRNDPTSQQRLDEIAEGTGVADTAADLNALAEMAEKKAALFALDESLPKDAAKQARTFASELLAGDDPTAGTEAQERRNRAFWVLDEATREVRDGLKFLWKKQPQKLAQLGTTYVTQLQRQSRARRRAGAGGQGGPAPLPQ